MSRAAWSLALLSLVLLSFVPGAGLAARAQDFSTGTPVVTPNPQAAALAEANAALAAGDYKKAVAVLAPLAAKNTGNAPLLYDLGAAYDGLEQEGAAQTQYKAAIAADPGYAQAHLALGLLLARKGDFAPARIQFAAAAGSDKADAALRAEALRAIAHVDANTQPAAARDELLEALKLSPETPADTLLAAELASGASGGSDAAEEAYRHVLAQEPDNADAIAGLAHVLVQEKHADEAAELLKTGVAAHPGDPVLAAGLASLEAAAGDFKSAVALVEPLHAAHPEDAAITRLLAGLYAGAGDYAQAEPLDALLLKARPDDVDLLVADGDALVHLHRNAAAEAVLARAVGLPANFARPAELGDAAGRLAFAASENNDPSGALRALEVRATVLPPTPAMLFLAAISHDKLHQKDAAIQGYRDFLAASNGALPDQELDAKARLTALEHTR